MPSPPFVCRHEAVHGVVAVSGGLEVRYLTTEPVKGALGFCSIAPPREWRFGEHGVRVPDDMSDPIDRDRVKAMIRVGIAGILSHHAHPVPDDDPDLVLVQRYLDTLHLHDPEAYLERLLRQTEDLKDRHEDAITEVSMELSWRRRMPGARLKAIMAEHPPTPRPRSPQADAILKRRPPDWPAIFAEIHTRATGQQMQPVRPIAPVRVIADFDVRRWLYDPRL